MGTKVRALQPGAVVGNRWRVVSLRPGRPGLERWSGVEVNAHAEVEILHLGPATSAGQRKNFLATHRGLASHPAGYPILYTGADGTVVRPAPLGTLASLERRLTGPEALAIAGWLAPAILVLHHNELGMLLPEDFAIEPGGTFRLAPCGLPAALPPVPEGLIAPELRGVPRPQVSAENGLYSLGAALYLGLTGNPPKNTRDHRGQPLPPVPPSHLVKRVGLPVNRTILGLLAVGPERRRRAAPPPPLSAPVWTHEPEVATSDSETEASNRDKLESHPALVVIQPRGRLSPAALRKLAGLMQVAPDTVEEMLRAGLPLPVAGAPDLQAARLKVAEFQKRRLPARAVSMKLGAEAMHTTVWSVLLLLTAAAAAMVEFNATLVKLAAVFAVFSVPIAFAWEAYFRHQAQAALAAMGRGDGPSLEGPALLDRAQKIRSRLGSSQLANHTETDVLTALEVTIKGLEDLSEAEAQITDNEGPDRSHVRHLYTTMRAELDALEAEVTTIIAQPESSREVELSTLLTRALAVGAEAESVRNKLRTDRR